MTLPPALMNCLMRSNASRSRFVMGGRMSTS